MSLALEAFRETQDLHLVRMEGLRQERARLETLVRAEQTKLAKRRSNLAKRREKAAELRKSNLKLAASQRRPEDSGEILITERDQVGEHGTEMPPDEEYWKWRQTVVRNGTSIGWGLAR